MEPLTQSNRFNFVTLLTLLYRQRVDPDDTSEARYGLQIGLRQPPKRELKTAYVSLTAHLKSPTPLRSQLNPLPLPMQLKLAQLPFPPLGKSSIRTLVPL